MKIFSTISRNPARRKVQGAVGVSLATALLLAFSALTAGPASAAVPVQAAAVTQAPAPQITPAQISEAFAELSASTIPRTVSTVGGASVTTFNLPDGHSFTFSSSAVASGPGIHPNLGGGFDSKGLYVSFNRIDQGALATGAGAGIAVAICAIPAVGWVACAIAAAIVATATYYVAAYGICSSSRYSVLRIYSGNSGDGCYRS